MSGESQANPKWCCVHGKMNSRCEICLADEVERQKAELSEMTKDVDRLKTETKTLNEKLQAAWDEIAQLKELRAEESRINEMEYNCIHNELKKRTLAAESEIERLKKWEEAGKELLGEIEHKPTYLCFNSIKKLNDVANNEKGR